MTGEELYRQRKKATKENWRALAQKERTEYEELAATSTGMRLSVKGAAGVLWGGKSLLGPGLHEK